MWLFAETSDGLVATFVLLAGVLGGGMTWLVNYLTARHERSRKEHKEDEMTIVDHLKEVERRCTEENKELKGDVRETNRRMVKVINHVMYLEGVLESKGIRFRKFSLDYEEGSGHHDTLPPIKAPKPSKIIKDESPPDEDTQ